MFYLCGMSNPAEPAPALITDLSLRCIQSVEASLGLKLDGTQDTLPILDHYLELVPADAASEITDLIVPMCAAYFGEVVRASLGEGRWVIQDRATEQWRLEFGRCFFHFNPAGVVIEAIRTQDAPDWNAHFQVLDDDRSAVREALERLGTVRDRDYYRLAVRFECIEQTHILLCERRQRRSQPAGHFSSEVYAVAMGENKGTGSH